MQKKEDVLANCYKEIGRRDAQIDMLKSELSKREQYHIAAEPEIYFKLKLAIIPIFLIGTPLSLTICHIISKKISVIWQLAKFVVTGVLNVLVDFSVLVILIFLFRNYLAINSSDILLGIGASITFYSLYKAISFIVANINSYYWNKYWTFQKKDGKQTEFIQFFVVSIVGFIINVV